MAMSHAATVIAFDFTCLTHLRSRVTEESLATEFLSASVHILGRNATSSDQRFIHVSPPKTIREHWLNKVPQNSPSLRGEFAFRSHSTRGGKGSVLLANT